MIDQREIGFRYTNILYLSSLDIKKIMIKQRDLIKSNQAN